MAKLIKTLELHYPMINSLNCYMAESVFAMRLVNLRSVTCYTDCDIFYSKPIDLYSNGLLFRYTCHKTIGFHKVTGF